MKKIFLILSIIIICCRAFGQVLADYNLTAISGTYTEITSGTSPLLTNGDADDGYFNGIPIGFTFTFCKVAYTSVAASTNGWLKFGGSTIYVAPNNDLSANAFMQPFLAPLWDDLDIQNPLNFSYLTEGTAPYRIFVAQWKNVKWNSGSDSAVISFQVKLYETTNNIEFIYKDEENPVYNGSASIGLSAASQDNQTFISLNNTTPNPQISSITSTNTLGTKPADGQVYRFAVDSILNPYPFVATAMNNSLIKLSWSGNPDSNNVLIVYDTMSITGTPVDGVVYTPGDTLPGGGTVIYYGDLTTFYHDSLSGNLTYYYKAFSVTGSDKYSLGIMAKSTTLPEPISVLPWNENFDGVSVPNLPVYWNKGTTAWVTTNNSNTFYDANAHSGTQFLRERDYVTNEYVWTPGFYLVAGVSYDFSFWWAADNHSGWTGHVFYNTSQFSTDAVQLGNPFVIASTFATSTYAQALYTLIPENTGTYYFAVRINCPSGVPNFISFDDFKLEPTSCPNITAYAIASNSVTQTTATISWTAPPSMQTSGFEYEVRINGVAGSGPTGLISSGGVSADVDSVNISGLNPSTTYSFYIRYHCSAGDTGSWTNAFHFTTVCDLGVLPYFENFDNIAVPSLPNCYSVSNDNNDTYSWATLNSHYHSSPNSIYIRYNQAEAMNDWFYTPKFHFESGKYYKVDFFYDNCGDSLYPEKLEVKWGSEANAGGMTSESIFENPYIVGAYRYGSGIISPAVSGDYFVGFHGYSDADMFFIVVDDIRIREIPFADIRLSQHNQSYCDTLGWVHLPVTLVNVCQDTVSAGDIVSCSYTVNNGMAVVEDFVLFNEILPGDSTTLSFSTPVHLNSYDTLSIKYSALWTKDVIDSNNHKVCTIMMKSKPVVELGSDSTICINQSILLDAGNPGAAYHWWNDSVSQTQLVNVSSCDSGNTCDYYVTVYKDGCSASDTITLTFDPCWGIEENDETGFLLYPNPFNDQIFFLNNTGFPVNEIRIYNAEGRLLISQQLEFNCINTALLGPGVYFIEFYFENNSTVHKMIVKY